MDKNEHENKEIEIRAAAFHKKMDASKFVYHHIDIDTCLKDLGSDRMSGLSSAEAARKLEKCGPNELDKEEDKTLWERIKEQFEDQLVQILLASATITFVLALMDDGDDGLAVFVEPFVILTILVLNAVVAIWQDSNADNALEALMEMQAIDCNVLRDKKWQVIHARDLVPGDIVKVAMGELVPADLRIIEVTSISLQAGQAGLTGESASVQKIADTMPESAQMLQEQKNMLFSSTTINGGNALCVVAYTGMQTAIGSVHSEVQKAKDDQEDTPLKQKLDQFSEQLAKIIFIICGLVWAMNFFKFWDPIHGSVFKGCIYYFKIAVALAVAAIPEGLPAVITTCLALGTRKMAQNNCIVRKLPSVETLGCTSTICSDKTGTLTKNLMCAIKFAVVGESAENVQVYDVNGNSYNPNEKVQHLTYDIYHQNKNFHNLMMVCTINNRSNIIQSGSEYKIQGEPTEGALKVLTEKIGGTIGKRTATDRPNAIADWFQEQHTKVATLDFSSQRKMMSTIISKDGGNVVLLKGAPDRVLNSCAGFMKADGTPVKFSNEKQREALQASCNKSASEGLRVLGIAVGLDGANMKHINAGNIKTELNDPAKYPQLESGCYFVGFACIQDPPRPEVKESIRQCRTAGVNVIMITGDAPETAVAIARQLEIFNSNKEVCFTGNEFEALSHEQKKKALEGKNGKVFSRVEPRHKREIVKILNEMGEIVAMTGDGVNDAPALKQAHIGIAMGITGTEVAKQASDMVLADDNFSTIVKAVEEGRSIYSNMKAFIRYLISSNIGEVASIFFTAALGIPEGFNSVQLLWVNLVTDGFPATALGFNPPDKDVMRQQPRKSNENLISGWVFFRYMVVGIYVGFATVGVFVYWYTMAETADGHTLVSMDQLMHWSECPNWEGFKVNNFVEGMDFSEHPCKYFTDGKLKASTLSLSVLVMIEMLNAYNALSEDNSLLTVTPLTNPYLIAATASSTILHCMILYVPFFNEVFSIHSMDMQEWAIVLAFSLPVLLVDEVLKFFGRIKNESELQARLKQD